MVTCGVALTGAELVITGPLLIMEVLSRRNKFVLYRQLLSLKEYVLIDPVTRVVETFSAIDSGGWLFTDQTRADVLELVSIECKLPMAAVFKSIENEAP